MKLGKYLAVVGLLVPVLTWAPPAAATTPPALVSLDASTPGHLKGTVVSPDQPYLVLRFEEGTAGPGRSVTATDGSAAFDVATWGYVGERPIWIQACTDQWRQSCDPPVEAPQTFVAQDVVPTSVTWSDDLTVGVQQITAEAVDTGGGYLYAEWTGPGHAQRSRLEPGSWSASSPDGVGSFVIKRCDELKSHACVTYPEFTSPTYTVRRNPGVTVNIPTTVAADEFTSVDIDTEVTGTYDISWRVTRDEQTFPLSGSATAQALTGEGALARIQIPSGTLSDGTYEFNASITLYDPDFGTYSKTVGSWGGPAPEIRINRQPPAISRVVIAGAATYLGIPALYPNIGTKDRPKKVGLQVDAIDHTSFDAVEIWSSAGALVRTWTKEGPWYWTTPQWTGTDQAGKQVPIGVYTVKVRDSIGQYSDKTAKIYVNTKRRVLRTWTKRVTARASLLESYVGRCSTLKRPAARGWAGSLGFYANTKCPRKTWRASAVSTTHRVFLPAADKYLSVKLQMYGGAAKARPRSWAGFRWFGVNGKWRDFSGVRPDLKLHQVGFIREAYAPAYVFSNRALYWGMATAAGDRYDAARFVVTVQYYALV